MPRRSISECTTLVGTGLHTGIGCEVKFSPAESGTRIKFRRVDLPGTADVVALVENVVATDYHTQLGVGRARIETTEHALAAVAALEIDDLLIEVTGPELPIFDGSARPYFDALHRARLRQTHGDVSQVEVLDAFSVSVGDATYEVRPADTGRISVSIEWDHPAIGVQFRSFDLSTSTFEKELADARTFGFLSEAADLIQLGLIKGANFDNVVVLTESGVKGTELRWPDEFVRHKATDLIGDLCLLGSRLRGEISAHRPSHLGNIALVRALKQKVNDYGISSR